MDNLEKAFIQDEREYEHFLEWLSMGADRGWISDTYCVTHDTPPVTRFEAKQFSHGQEPCIVNVRLLLLHDGPRYVVPDYHGDENKPE